MQFAIHLLASDWDNQLVLFNNLVPESKNLIEFEFCAVDKSIAYELLILRPYAHFKSGYRDSRELPVATAALIPQRLGAMLVVGVQPTHHGLRVAPGALRHLRRALALG